MEDMPNSDKTTISGRDFTFQEIEEIRETVRMFSKFSLFEIASTLCENLGWTTPSGQYKLESCLQMLKKLETQGVLTLPAKRTTNKGGKERIIISHQTDKPSEIAGDLTDIKPIELTPVINREEIRLWNEYVERYHILGYKRPFGAHQRYFIISRSASEPKLGCILFAASSWALAARDEWIGWSENDRSKRLNLIINNTRFLIFPWVQIKNLASHALSLAAKRVRHDWQTRFCYQPVLLETFVDEAKYRGTCYQAANWIKLGKTTGRGRMDRHKQHLSTPKLIYAYPLVDDFRSYLRGEVGLYEKTLPTT